MPGVKNPMCSAFPRVGEHLSVITKKNIEIIEVKCYSWCELSVIISSFHY